MVNVVLSPTKKNNLPICDACMFCGFFQHIGSTASHLNYPLTFLSVPTFLKRLKLKILSALKKKYINCN